MSSRPQTPTSSPSAASWIANPTAVGRGAAPAFGQLLVPLRLAVLVDHAAVGQAAPHVGVVEPDRQLRKVVAAQQPEGRALAGDQEVVLGHGRHYA